MRDSRITLPTLKFPMTILRIAWSGEGGPPWSPVVPVRLRSLDREAVLVMGEAITVRPGEVELEIDVPSFRFARLIRQVPAVDKYTIRLSPAILIPSSDKRAEYWPPSVAINLDAWGSADVGPKRSVEVALTFQQWGLTVSRIAGSEIPLSFDVATRVTPRRRLAVPPVGPSDLYRVMWQGRGGALPRPSVEPTDPGGQLLIRYLLGGQYALASAAARGVERLRGGENPLDWAAPSYTQLLIGYAYALSYDGRRLSVWCRRTAAALMLQGDGLVLEAASAWHEGNPKRSAALLGRASSQAPPTLAFGVELGTHLAMLLAGLFHSDATAVENGPGQASLAPCDQGYVRAADSWMRLMTVVDAETANLSIPQTRNLRPSLAGAAWYRKASWLVRFAVSRWSYDRVLRGGGQKREVRQVIQEEDAVMDPQGNRPSKAGGFGSWSVIRVWTLLFALVLLVFLIVILALLPTLVPVSNAVWLLIGAGEAFAFAGFGVMIGASAYQRRAEVAEARAVDAQHAAEYSRNHATLGRALAAVLQAEETDVEGMDPAVLQVLRRHQQLSIHLFGPLVPLRFPPEEP